MILGDHITAGLPHASDTSATQGFFASGVAILWYLSLLLWG